MKSTKILQFRISLPLRLFLQARSGVSIPERKFGRRYWVLGRALCRFGNFPVLEGESDARRLAALQLKVKEWSPFSTTGSHIHITGDRALVWIWDQATVLQAMADHHQHHEKFRLIPETCLRLAVSDGLRLTESLDGCEGQYWRDGELVSSRWWPQPPSPADWLTFQHAAGVNPDEITAVVPLVASASWLTRPWTRGIENSTFNRHRIDPVQMTAALAALAMAGYAYLGAQWLHTEQERAGLVDTVARLTRAADPVFVDRAAAENSLQMARALVELDPYPNPLEILARVAEKLPSNGSRLGDWNYQTGDLQFTISAPQSLDTSFYVRTYQNTKGFTDVSADRGNDDHSLRIHIRVLPK